MCEAQTVRRESPSTRGRLPPAVRPASPARPGVGLFPSRPPAGRALRYIFDLSGKLLPRGEGHVRWNCFRNARQSFPDRCFVLLKALSFISDAVLITRVVRAGRPYANYDFDRIKAWCGGLESNASLSPFFNFFFFCAKSDSNRCIKNWTNAATCKYQMRKRQILDWLWSLNISVPFLSHIGRIIGIFCSPRTMIFLPR